MTYAFKDFRLDPDTRELVRAGARVNVQPKVFKLLLHLVAHRHRSVTNEELLTELWAGERVSPASITTAVRQARRALGDAGNSQDAIRTMRGHGYRFVLPVTIMATGAGDALTSSAPPLRLTVRDTSDAEDATDRSFVGRAGVLSGLDCALAMLETGDRNFLLLQGEPGVGKTRTLHELAARARRVGMRVWFARCLEGEGAPPFWPVMQLVREAVDDLGADSLRALMGDGAADIAHAIPDLHRWFTDLSAAPELAPQAVRFRFFDSFTTFVKRAAQQDRLLLIFDDLQHADEPTARLLTFLVKQLARARVMIAGAARPAEQGEVTAELIRDLSTRASSMCIDLVGFDEPEVADYLIQRTGGAAPEEIVARLHDLTAGNPLYLQQLVDGVIAHDSAAGEPAWEQLVNPSHRGGVVIAIERQLDTVSAACRTLLQAAAVLGRDFSFGLLCEVSASRDKASRERVLALLSEARCAGLVFTLDGPNRYRFKHALVRDTLYDHIAADVRAALHQATALALEARGAGSNSTQLAQLADHFLHAAPLLGTERALHYTMKAADDAVAKLAFEEAAAHIDRALEVVSLETPDRLRRLELLLAKGEALSRATSFTTARRALREAVDLARALDARDHILRSVILIARSPEDGTPDPMLVTWLREALDVLDLSDPRRPELVALLAKALSYASEHDEYVGIALSALESARQVDGLHRTQALYACHEALAGPQHLTARMRISDELGSLGHRLGDPLILMHAALTQVWNAAERGDIDTIDLGMEALEALASGAREPYFNWCTALYRAMRALLDGDPSRARELTQRTLEYGPVVGEELVQHAHATQISSIHSFQGQLVEAEAVARKFSMRYPALGSWRATLAVAHAYRGHPDHARRVLDDLMRDDMRALCNDPYRLAALSPTALLCSLVGTPELARTLHTSILPFADSCGQISIGQTTHGPMTRHLGLLAMRMGDSNGAVAYLKRAIDHAERMRSPTFVSVCCASYASALLAAGAHIEAREACARAVRLARECQLYGIIALCEPLRLTLQIAI